MELGALLCTPNQPKCDNCPVSQLCLSHRQGRTREIPNLEPRVGLSTFFVIPGDLAFSFDRDHGAD
jgi:adenine-specific DNA glycosylase